jgi:hypothetical protein
LELKSLMIGKFDSAKVMGIAWLTMSLPCLLFPETFHYTNLFRFCSKF